MTVARREIEWRRLGNGWCTRRAYLDCRHELVCERCVHFNTDRMFLPVLEAQQADAIRKGQQARADLFAKLVGALEALALDIGPRAGGTHQDADVVAAAAEGAGDGRADEPRSAGDQNLVAHQLSLSTGFASA